MKKNYCHNLNNETVSYTVFKNPIGLTGLAATQKGLIRIANKLSSEKAFEKLLVRNLGFQIKKNPKYFKILIEQFQSYFKGELRSFKFPLDLRLGTPFQQRVWERLLTIPYGVTRSYKWLAKSINNPNSARAVGNAFNFALVLGHESDYPVRFRKVNAFDYYSSGFKEGH